MSQDISYHTGFYSSILESIAEGIIVIGLDRKIIFANKMALDLIGLHGETAEGKTCNSIMKTDLCLKNCPLNSLHTDNKCVSHFMNINLYREDKDSVNTSVPLCLNVAPLNDENGNIIGIIENFRPMSEAIKVIESLKESNVVLAQEKDKVDSIIEGLADGVYTVDTEFRITSFNRGMEKITGLKEPEVIGLTCREVLNSDKCDSSCPLAYTMKNGYGIANITERIAAKNGNIIPVSISTAFLRDGSQDKGMIATVRDASEIEKLKKEINDRYHFSSIIGKSSTIQQIFELIETLQDTDCAVLIEGESGTGKELVARAIHHESSRRNRPFVKVNCSAIVEGLFESELFGHVKGAFTGAIRNKIGKFELAEGGTIFLDEIGEMPLSLQSKLLRVIQDKEFERVGDSRTIKVDVRIIAATNKHLKNEILSNNFREDLYYRLCIVPIKMPPLRERREDIPLLIEHFLQKCSLKIPGRAKITEITPSAMSALMDHNWPGNVRELENAIEHAYIRTKTNTIDVESLPSSVTSAPLPSSSLIETDNAAMSRNDIERHFIIESFKRHQGNKSKIAKDLGISRTTIWRKMKKYNINVSY